MKITPNFAAEEFFCHSGEEVPSHLMPNLERLVLGVLQPLRDRLGRLVVISGYRTPAYNRAVGGAPLSAHVTAEGADVRPARWEDIDILHAVALEMHQRGELPALGGLGEYPGRWCHLDVRKAKDGHLRRWRGRGVGSEVAG